MVEPLPLIPYCLQIMLDDTCRKSGEADCINIVGGKYQSSKTPNLGEFCVIHGSVKIYRNMS